MTGVVIIQKPVHWFASKSMDWFLYDDGLRHEIVKQKMLFPKILRTCSFENTFNPFHVTGLFRYPLKISGNLWFSDVFRGYRKRPVVWNGLKEVCLCCWSEQDKFLSTHPIFRVCAKFKLHAWLDKQKKKKWAHKFKVHVRSRSNYKNCFLFLYYLNRTFSFHFNVFPSKVFAIKLFVVWMLFKCIQ